MLPALLRALPISLARPFTAANYRTMSSSLVIPTTAEYAAEARLAVQAVVRASFITHKVQSSLKQQDTETKVDKSPVTVADYASQALLSHLLNLKFPSDPLIGEEDTTSLRSSDAQPSSMRATIVDLVNEALALEGGDVGDKLEPLTEEQVLQAIDRGNSEGGNNGRWWTCDPIDGTLGFLRGEQYAVCLTLISQGVPVLGLLACPNLPFPSLKAPTSKGSFFLATTGAGAFQRSLSLPLDLSAEATAQSGTANPFIPIHLPHAASAGPHAILESVEASHSSHSINESISGSIEIGEHLRMDSQAKYGALARGDGEMYLRVPTKYSGGKAYQEKVWDHASGFVLVKEAGGRVGDCWGRELDFGVGRTLKSNDGVIATSSPIYSNVIAAVRKAIIEANPSVEPPAEAAAAAVAADAVADELKEAKQAGGVETGKDGIVIGEEQKAPIS